MNRITPHLRANSPTFGPPSARRTGWRNPLIGGALLVSFLSLVGCGSSDPGKARSVEPVIRDVPSVLRGTIGSESSLRGTEPVLVAGYGLVVGLNGTGGGPLPETIASTMERELTRGGIGKGGPETTGPIAGKSPRQVLADPNVAVVIVEGVIAAGSPKDATFDVRVRPLPGSSVTSLEGGTLWTTELRLGPAVPTGMARTRKIAEARGPIFINPFADPAGGKPVGGVPSSGDSVRRDIGRALGGGIVTNPLPMEIILDNSGHARVASVVSSINSRFPPGPGDDGSTAKGRSGTSIAVRVPRSYQERTDEFLKLLENLRIDNTFSEEFAKRYSEEILKQPVLADDLSWCLRAIGKPAIPFVVPLYDHPEFIPRLAALRTGAGLGDPRTSPYLLAIAEGKAGEPASLRVEAIGMLARVGSDPNINFTLRDLAAAGPLEIRVAAYETLLIRGDVSVQRMRLGSGSGTFVIDLVPATEPLIYIVQQGRPRMVIFGESLRINRPSLAGAWSDRLMLKSDAVPPGTSPKDPAATTVGLYYKDYRSGRVTQLRVSDDLKALVRFMAHTPTPENPEPGLALSYSEIAGALYQLQRQGAVPGFFATETDKLAAGILVAERTIYVEERPESEADRGQAEKRAKLLEDDRQAAERAKGNLPGAPAGAGDGPTIVPIAPKPKKD